MAESPVWKDAERPYFPSSQFPWRYGDLDYQHERISGDTLHWQIEASQSLASHHGIIPTPLLRDPMHMTNIGGKIHGHTSAGIDKTKELSSQPMFLFGEIPMLQQQDKDILSAPQICITSPTMIQYPTRLPKQFNSSNDIELACFGCPKRKFSRKADKEGHDKEQHRCPHRGCMDSWFSVDQRRHHMKSHGNINGDFKCGTCDLSGRPKSSFKRCEKLGNHFEAVHGVARPYSKVQCLHSACYDQDLDGGLYFVSHDELV